MLVLEFDLDEDAVIDLREYGLGIVTVQLVSIHRGHVRLGFEADKKIKIQRRVVFEKREAAKT